MAVTILAIVIIPYDFFLRRFFKINKIEKSHTPQRDILIEIALRQGVEPNVISTIINRSVKASPGK
jgi:hypothetical protein